MMRTVSTEPHAVTSAESPGRPPIALGLDGYVRLTLSVLVQTPFDHVLSGLDDEVLSVEPHGAQRSAITGYTEWLSHTIPALTLGWDWELCGGAGQTRFVRTGLPRSNIMLVGVSKRDLGDEATALLLADVVDALVWQDLAFAAVKKYY
jgi:hypothetical protein